MKYSGGTVYVDLSSGHMFIQPQISLKASETIIGKRRFERMLNNFGHDVKVYLGDNGVFKSKEFQEELRNRGQEMEFCGVGAHHQNGVAERAIRTVSEAARTMMIHAAIYWPGSVSMDLWPMAVEYATYIYNRMPGMNTGVAPLELITGARLNPNDLRGMRVWGCPCYVLDPKVQDGNKLPRWVPKARRGQFLGRSRTHASSIGLIKNMTTGYLSTQFHVVYDDFFTTVASTGDNVALEETWNYIYQFMREAFRDEDDLDRVPELTDEWMTESETERRQRPEPVSNQTRTANIPNFQDVNEDVQDRDLDNEERDSGIDDDVSSRDNREVMSNPEGVRRNPQGFSEE